jgi:type IV secretory pathway VirB10-like protein
MEINRTTIGIVAIVSLAAGAAGALITTRAGRTEAASEQPALTTPGPAVEESEGVVAVPPPDPAPAPAPAPAPTVRESAPRPPARPAPIARAPQAPARTPIPAQAPPSSAPAPAPAQAQVEAPAPLPVEAPRVAEVAPAPPEPRFDDLELPSQSVIGLQLETSVSSETARVEDEVVARVTRDVKVGDRVAIPAGAKAHGEVTLVERGARVRERARLGVRFTSIVLSDGTRVPIDTEPIYREGSSVRNENAAKIGGGAIGGAIIGGILGGAKGAAIGGAIGGGAGTAAVAAGGRNAATLPSGAPVTVRIERPVTVTVER